MIVTGSGPNAMRRTTIHDTSTFVHTVGGGGNRMNSNAVGWTATMSALSTKQQVSDNQNYPFGDDLTSSTGNMMRAVTMRCRVDSDLALDDQASNGNSCSNLPTTGIARSVTSRRLTRTTKNIRSHHRSGLPLSSSWTTIPT